MRSRFPPRLSVRRALRLSVLVRTAALVGALVALPAVGQGEPSERAGAAATAVLPAPSPLFATRGSVGNRRVIGFLVGVGGLRPMGIGTTVSVRCVAGCSGSQSARIAAARTQLQVRFARPLRLSRGAVVELRATRSGSTGRWQRYRMVKQAQGVFAKLGSQGCLTALGKRTCPASKPATPTSPPVTQPSSPDTQAVTFTPAPMPTVAHVSPDDRSNVKGVVRLVANASAAAGIEWQAYYATDPATPVTTAWRVLGRDMTAGDGFGLDWDTRKVRNQGDGAKGTVNIVAIAVDSSGALTAARDYRRVNIVNGDLTGDGYVGCADLQFVISQYGGSGSADINGDGSVDISDVSALLTNYYPPPDQPPCD